MASEAHLEGHGGAHGEAANHPTPKTYAKVALVLTILTMVEVWVFYVDALRVTLVPILIVLSAIKFSLVAMFYMHLKFDHPVFSRLLLSGIVIAFGVFLWLLALFTYSHPAMPHGA
jgi:cytochrome c oxidase subunit 4